MLALVVRRCMRSGGNGGVTSRALYVGSGGLYVGSGGLYKRGVQIARRRRADVESVYGGVGL